MIDVYIYVIWNGESYRKIGFSENPSKRLYSLQHATPQLLKLEKLYRFQGKKIARQIEYFVHGELEMMGLHRRGEWFKADRASTDDVVRVVADRFGYFYEEVNTKEYGEHHIPQNWFYEDYEPATGDG